MAGLYGVVTVQWLPIMLYFHIAHVRQLPDVHMYVCKNIFYEYVKMVECHPQRHEHFEMKNVSCEYDRWVVETQLLQISTAVKEGTGCNDISLKNRYIT